MNVRLTTEGEQRWQELRQHIDWNNGFALFFYFSNNQPLTDLLKTRLDKFLMGKSTRLQEITYQANDPQWLEDTLDKLFQRAPHWQLLHSPVWIALHQNQSKQALTAYRSLLVRLNERRDLWRYQYQAPVIFILPTVLKTLCGTLAPDLWSIRVLAEVLGDDLVAVSPQETGGRTAVAGPPALYGSVVLPAREQAMVDEWLRLEQHDKQGRASILAGQRAVDALLTFRLLAAARGIAEKILDWSRQKGDTPESLRDLSVSLNKVGDVSKQQGRWNDAQSAYEESLGISRRLCVMLGDTPESLRDLAVSLANIGMLHEQALQQDQAMACYQEGVMLGERLAQMLPDLPAYTEVKPFFQSRLTATRQME